MSKNTRNPFAPVERESIQLGDYGTYRVAETTYSRVQAQADFQRQLEGLEDSADPKDAARLLCEMLALSLDVPADEEPLADRLLDGFMSDTVTLDGLTRAARMVQEIQSDDTAAGNA